VAYLTTGRAFSAFFAGAAPTKKTLGNIRPLSGGRFIHELIDHLPVEALNGK
jgi:hypothetical protein